MRADSPLRVIASLERDIGSADSLLGEGVVIVEACLLGALEKPRVVSELANDRVADVKGLLEGDDRSRMTEDWTW